MGGPRGCHGRDARCEACAARARESWNRGTVGSVTVAHDLERFLAFVAGELGAREAQVFDDPPPEHGSGEPSRDLSSALPDGRFIVVRFDAPPAERAPQQRRLDMLASTFGELADEAKPVRSSRPPAARSLHEELRVVCARGGAFNARGVDANSPVVWGAARPEGLGPEWPVAGGGGDTGDDDGAGRAGADPVSRAALERVLRVADLAGLRKGKHLRHIEREGPGPFAAYSFASIYLLVLVYDAPFDELRAERSSAQSLPRIEQLVLALPPLDPSPVAGAAVIAMKRRRSR